jgi:hypothetical protein
MEFNVDESIMKIKFENLQNLSKTTKIGLCASIAAAAMLSAGCAVRVTPYGVVAAPAPPPPAPVVVAPPPAPAPVLAPEYYVWDGYEYVGWYNGQYLYWSGGAWFVAPEIVIGRFHGWERYHPDWRRSAIRWERGHREPHR